MPVILDTGVIIEYIDEAGAFNEHARAIFSTLLAGRLNAIIPHPVLAETYYVATKVYRRLGLSNPELRASRLVEWLYGLSSISVGEGLELAREAGRVKLKFGLALTDCYVLAASKLFKGKAIFRSAEREMKERIDGIRSEFDVLFLEEYR